MLVQRTPVHADPNRLVIPDGHFDHRAEIVVILAAHAYVAGIDAVLSQCLRAFRVFGQQKMPVIVEIANDGNVNVLLRQFLKNRWDSLCSSVIVHRHADHFRSSSGKLRDLLNSGLHVCRVSICHRLHDHGHIAANANIAYFGCYALPALNDCHSL